MFNKRDIQRKSQKNGEAFLTLIFKFRQAMALLVTKQCKCHMSELQFLCPSELQEMGKKKPNLKKGLPLEMEDFNENYHN